MFESLSYHKPSCLNTNKQNNNSFFAPVIQTKPASPSARLSLNTPGDEYEQEADAMAESVMRMSDNANPNFFKPSFSSIYRKCSECEEEEKQMHRKELNSSDFVFTQTENYINSLSGKGQPLTQTEKSLFEPKFGYDFSNVRLHTNLEANKSANDINALAYTSGNNIVFNEGQYIPETYSGKRLLGHELTHVIQQVSDSSKIQREEAAAEIKCPASYTIEDDVYTAIGEAWKKSGHGGDTVTEQGGRIVTDKDKKRVIRTGSGGGGSISLPAEQAGDTTTGTFHTHPYSKSEGSTIGVSFSGDDIKNFVAGGQGSVKYIGAGSCDFLLNTVNTAARDKCKKEDLPKRWDDAFAKSGGTFQEKVEKAVKATIVNCGMCYYRACRPDDASPIPKDAKLV